MTDSCPQSRAFSNYTFWANLNGGNFAGDTVLEIDVDPLYGDPDLYIARDLKGDRVVKTTFWRWRSRRFGRDVVAIPMVKSSDLGVYQIGVYSYSATACALSTS